MKILRKFAIVVAGFMMIAATDPQGGVDPVAPQAQKVPDDYVIGPGDSLQIQVWQNPELSTIVPVRPDGKISTQLVADMVAVGKTSSQLARDIEGVLSTYVRTPKVTVIVTNAISAYSQIKVVGQVRQTVSIPYREGLKVLDVVQAAGGLGEFAAPNRARIVREVKGKLVEQKVKLGDLLNKGDLRQNFALQPGDVLVVPESIF